jgi:hypothetical protein
MRLMFSSSRFQKASPRGSTVETEPAGAFSTSLSSDTFQRLPSGPMLPKLVSVRIMPGTTLNDDNASTIVGNYVDREL